MISRRTLGSVLVAALALVGVGCGGGSTSSTGCTSADSCPGTDSFCAARTCTAGKCGFDYTAADTPVPTQIAGDCLQVVCNGSGGTTSVAADADLPVDGKVCTSDVCTGGVATNPPLAADSPCGTGLVCDGNGACIGCVTKDECPGTDTICQARTCTAGTCGFSNAADGTTCDDGNASTTGDQCVTGVCTGVDHCAGVTCMASDQCHDAGVCVDHATGACSNPAKADNTSCSDGDPNTTGDVCTAGVCVGTDLCASVTCTALDQCHDAGTCDHATGVCSNPAKENGTTCDDGNASTTGDACTAGVCAGVDHCSGVVCAPLDQCHDAGVCINHATGACSTPDKADGTTCNDGDPNTAGDVCTGGTCAGVDHCLGVVCTPLDACHDAGTCDHATGTCSTPSKTDGATCDDGNPCTSDACSAGACVGTPVDSGTSCGSALACDGAGACHGAPSVTSTTPLDGSYVLASTTVRVTFDEPMNPSTLTGQVGMGECTGSIQISVNDFTTCVGFSAAAPTMSSGGTVATLIPMPGLLINRLYRIRVTTAASGANGLALAAPYSSTSGFLTINPLVGPGSAWNESGDAGEVYACVQSSPDLLTGVAGSTANVYGWVIDDRYRDPVDVANPLPSYAELITWVGYGPATSNPEYQAGWNWTLAPFDAMVLTGSGTAAQYRGTITLPAAGTYVLAFRVSLDAGVTWTYCDGLRGDYGAGSNPAYTFDLENLSVLMTLP